MELRNLDEVEFHSTSELVLEILRSKTQNTESDLYFRIQIAFFLAQMASSMRATINTPHRGKLPINIFACCLGSSGMGKGHSLNILEHEICKSFKTEFMNGTFPAVAAKNIETAAMHKAALNSTDFVEEEEILNKEFYSYGAFPFSFDSGTAPAYKQVRTKAQIAGIGSLNMLVDEIGTNLLTSAELFAVNLEAYDIGLIKQKIIKNSADNKRAEERDDPVPSNMLIFGTPSKLFNGGREEMEFYSLLETGYARRLLFAVGSRTVAATVTAEEVFERLTSGSTDTDVDAIAEQFANLSAIGNYDKEIVLQKDVALINIQYQLNCERAAEEMSDYESIRKAELQHRYFKAIKLAGAYAFSDGATRITEEHMYAAIKLVELSGKAFSDILTRDKNYARLAKYIATVKKEVTHADLVEDLPFYTGSASAKADLINLATSWGYRNNIIIKKTVMDNIEFFKGESLKETDMDKLRVSYSTDQAYMYLNQELRFDQLGKLTQAHGYHWVNHHLVGGYDVTDEGIPKGHRSEEDSIQGFNLIVIDCDGGVSLDTAMLVLNGVKAAYYTTKRHQTEGKDRFRIVIPMKYVLNLTAKDYKEFMNNVYEWLPFRTDTETNTRSKKWLAHAGEYHSTEGELFDPLQFIPKTSKNADRLATNKKMANLDGVERFFAAEWSEGGRNNILIRYGMMIMDDGAELPEVCQRVHDFNKKFTDTALPESEVNQTVIKSLTAKYKGML